MTSFSARLLRQGGIYALGNVALKASGLLLAVLYLNPAYLSVEAFGYFSILFVTAQLGIYLAGLGLGTGLMKFLADPAYARAHAALPFTTLAATVGAALGAGGLLAAAARPLAVLMLDDAGQTGLVYLLAVYVAMKGVGAVPLMVLRVQERAGWYVAALLAEVVVLIGAAYALMVVLGWGLTGLMAAYALAASVSAAVLTAVLLLRVPWRFEARLLGPLVRFGGPLVLASVAGWFLHAGDRYLLKWLADPATVGLYEWAARLAGVLNMLLVQSFNLAFTVIGLKALGEHRGDVAIHRRTLRHFLALAGGAALALALLAHDLTRLLPAAAAYLRADGLVLLLALGFVCYGLYYVLINVAYAGARTGAVSLNVLAAAVLNAGLNVVLIPILGVYGAAAATLLAYLALAVGAAHVARREAAALRFPWLRVLGVLALVGGLFALGWPTRLWPAWARLPARLGLVAAYPVLVVAFGYYTRAEVRSAAAWLRERIRR